MRAGSIVLLWLALTALAPGLQMADAIHAKDLAAVQRLIASQGTETPGAGGATPLMLAAEEDAVQVAAALIAAGAKVDAERQGGVTALFHAAATGSPAMIRLLIEHGARVDATVSGNRSPVTTALRYGNWPALEALAAGGAKLDESPELLDRIVPREVTFLGPEIQETLANRLFADPRSCAATPAEPSPALQRFAALLDPQLVAACLRTGAEVNGLDSEGRTALLIATGPARLELLLGGLAFVGSVNKGQSGPGPTTMEVRAKLGHGSLGGLAPGDVAPRLKDIDRRRLEVVRLLLAAGASSEIATRRGLTVADNLARLGSSELTAVVAGASSPPPAKR